MAIDRLDGWESTFRAGEAVAVSELRKLDGVVRAFGWERFCQGYGRQLLARALVISGEREEGLAPARSEVQAGPLTAEGAGTVNRP